MGAEIATGGGDTRQLHATGHSYRGDERYEGRLLGSLCPHSIVIPYDTFEEALDMADDSVYGLQAGIYTNDINKAFKAVKRLDVGGIMINDVPTFRVDHMPYGGNKESGLGREGLKYAMEEMTNIKMVCFNLADNRH